MSLFDDITWKDWIFLLIILLLVVKIWQMDREYERTEGFNGGDNTLSNEAIQAIASVYNQGELTVSKLNVTDDLNVTKNLTVNGQSILKGKLTANNVPALTVGSFTANSNAIIKGDLTNDGSATFKKGVNISGKHKTDNTTLTVMDPSGAGANSHFYYKGNSTYIGGSDALIIRTKKGSGGIGDRTLLRVGGDKLGGYNNVYNPLEFRKRYDQKSDYIDSFLWRYSD
jgi:hypothetical protein